MDALRTGVLLFLLLEPVSAREIFFTDPVICYFLDGILVVYCIVATALFFREKFSHVPSGPVGAADGGIYQELNRAKDADAYEVLNISKEKKKAGKKKKKSGSTPAAAEEKDKDPYESLTNGSTATAPPLSPH